MDELDLTIGWRVSAAPSDCAAAAFGGGPGLVQALHAADARAEPGESPRAACNREIYEELGVSAQVGRLLSVDWAPHPEEGDKMLFIFDGGQLNANQLASITFQDGEIAEYAFVEPERLDQLTIPRLARRLRATVEALSTPEPAYLENGDPSPQAPTVNI